MSTRVNDANFDAEVLRSSEPVLVDFWAEWCGPCKAMDPILDDLSRELAGKVKIVKLDVDGNPSTVVKYNVRVDADADGVQGWRAGRHQGRRGTVARATHQMAGSVRRLTPVSRPPRCCRPV